MQPTEEQIKQIILDETKKYLKEIELAKKLKNVKGLTLDAFFQVINVLSQDINIPLEETIQVYLELALDLKRNWGIKQYEAWPDEEKEIFLKTTYPNTTQDESEDLLISSFTNSTLKKVIYSDILLAVEKAQDAKKEIKAGEYLGPDEPGADPKSPYWKEYLEEASSMEEVIKEETVNYLKENE